ncbi:calcium-activated potassium channel subunit beta-3 [Synchiropus picturatus]
MFFNKTSPKHSFSIPVNINLQGARRRQTRELLHTAAALDSQWGRGEEGQQRARTQTPESSTGEDRAILLGFSMMAFSVLMFSVVAITMVKPHVNRWEKVSGCVLLSTEVQDEGVDCRGVSKVPCLRATVNLTASGQTALLHFDEEALVLAAECFYVPKCRMSPEDLQQEVLKVKSSLDAHLGSSCSCFLDLTRPPGHVILNRNHPLRRSLRALLWPSLMLGGGALLVGLVKLTQCLAHLSSQVSSRPSGGLVSQYKQGKFYRLVRWSSAQT